jgi:hypothetical protein
VSIRVPDGRSVSQAHFLVSGKTRSGDQARNVVSSTVPSIDLHESSHLISHRKTYETNIPNSERLVAALSCDNQCLRTGRLVDERADSLVQNNLRQVDATLDARRLAEQLADMRANVVLMGMGGIVSYYPTAVRTTIPARICPPGAICSVMSCANATRARFASSADTI